MGGQQAAGVLLTVKRDQLWRKGIEMTKKQEKELTEPILKKYETEGSPYYSTEGFGMMELLILLILVWYLVLGFLHR